MKVVFTPHVDKFEVLQIKGLFNKFNLIVDDELTITAASGGARSRPAKFKIQADIAPILNLVVVLREGKV